jgi:alkanesulfonate monooxygenase SsuD/methylene tetrahydromethanopterin reductase-like flavin-dependent oxidoreductase (luciferase family)
MAFSDTREASEESALYGTPDEIAAKLQKLRQLGVEYVLLNGGGLVGHAQDSLPRFAREVMPAFVDEPRARVVG